MTKTNKNNSMSRSNTPIDTLVIDPVMNSHLISRYYLWSFLFIMSRNSLTDVCRVSSVKLLQILK